MSISPDPVSQMLTGFWASKVLMAAVEMEVFTKLEGRQGTEQELQQVMGMDPGPSQVFASALVSIGLFEAKAGRFSNSQFAAFLSEKSPP